MHAEKANSRVNMMARLLEARRSGFYEWERRRGWEDLWAGAREAVRRIWIESDGRFGFRFVHACLPDKFSRLTPCRVRKLMRELGIRGCTPNTGKRTTIQDPERGTRRTSSGATSRPRCLPSSPAGDITCLRTGEGWLYLATVIDLATRMVVGWSMSERMTADIVVAALGNAKGRGYVAKNAAFRSDRGSQYTSRMLLDWAEENNVGLSCSRIGNCHDNAVAESFFATSKNEMYCRRSFKTRADARRAVFNYIEVFYNRRRPHSTMGYQVPGEFMDTFFARTAPGWGKLPIAA